jgi:hypothetical protein
MMGRPRSRGGDGCDFRAHEAGLVVSIMMSRAIA